MLNPFSTRQSEVGKTSKFKDKRKEENIMKILQKRYAFVRESDKKKPMKII